MKLLGESDKPVNSLLTSWSSTPPTTKSVAKPPPNSTAVSRSGGATRTSWRRAPIVEFLNQNKNLPDKLGKVPGSTRREAGRPRVGSTSRVLSLERAIPGAEHDPERSGGAQDG